jgi:hypothetical protein
MGAPGELLLGSGALSCSVLCLVLCLLLTKPNSSKLRRTEYLMMIMMIHLLMLPLPRQLLSGLRGSIFVACFHWVSRTKPLTSHQWDGPAQIYDYAIFRKS